MVQYVNVSGSRFVKSGLFNLLGSPPFTPSGLVFAYLRGFLTFVGNKKPPDNLTGWLTVNFSLYKAPRSIEKTEFPGLCIGKNEPAFGTPTASSYLNEHLTIFAYLSNLSTI